MTRMGRAERKAGEEWSYNQFASGSRIADRTWTIQFGIWDRGMNNNSIKAGIDDNPSSVSLLYKYQGYRDIMFHLLAPRYRSSHLRLSDGETVTLPSGLSQTYHTV
jgi:hypothetical protein